MGASPSGARRVTVHAGVPPRAGPPDSDLARRREFLCRPRNPAIARAGRTDRLPILHRGRSGDAGRQSQRLDAEHRRDRECARQCAGDDAASGAGLRPTARRRRRPLDPSVRRAGPGARLMAVAAPRTDLDVVGMTEEDSHEIVRVLEREPNDLELGMFGALWSEHCSYKTTRPLLRQLPTTGEGVLQGPGENAGVVDIGDGLAVVFKIESHTHRWAMEPYQGAATGVGGILRDIFTMGARPLAILDSLRFGPPHDPRSRYLFQGVVEGIGGYGNCFGCPTVGGEVYFDEGYAANPIVNAMCVGLVRHDRVRLARAEQAGDRLLLVGAGTGRDGIHGASFASVEMDEHSPDRRPAVQVANPFMEKVLCEACLQLNELDGVVAIQDLGAAGLTGAACELAHRGARGVAIDAARVSRRERGTTPYEVMLSESQERMLVLVKPEAGQAAHRGFDAFDLHAGRVGAILRQRRVRIRDRAAVVADLPLDALIDGVPIRSLMATAAAG